jgi:hypothetical protein
VLNVGLFLIPAAPFDNADYIAERFGPGFIVGTTDEHSGLILLEDHIESERSHVRSSEWLFYLRPRKYLLHFERRLYVFPL